MSEIFKGKDQPLITWSRVVHFFFACTLTAYGGHLFKYRGSIWSGIGSIFAGLGWELSNKYLDKKGYHPYADAMDFWSFVAGALTGGVGWLIFSKKEIKN